MANHLIDPALFQEINQVALSKILPIYLKENEKALEKLKAAFNKADNKEIRFWSHAIKGSAKMIKAVQIYPLASEIEKAALNGNMIKQEELDKLIRNFTDLKQYIESEIMK